MSPALFHNTGDYNMARIMLTEPQFEDEHILMLRFHWLNVRKRIYQRNTNMGKFFDKRLALFDSMEEFYEAAKDVLAEDEFIDDEMEIADTYEFCKANPEWLFTYMVNKWLDWLYCEYDGNDVGRTRLRDVSFIAALYHNLSYEFDFVTLQLDEPEVNHWYDDDQVFEDWSEERYNAYAAKYPERISPY